MVLTLNSKKYYPIQNFNSFDYKMQNFSDRLFGGIIPQTEHNLAIYEAYTKTITHRGMVYAQYHHYKLLKEMCIDYDIRH